MDYGRQLDLEALAKEIANTNNRDYREYLQKIAQQIINESTTIRSLREEMIGAFKVGDIDKVKRIRLHIQRVRLEETNGQSWGNSKGNKNG